MSRSRQTRHVATAAVMLFAMLVAVSVGAQASELRLGGLTTPSGDGPVVDEPVVDEPVVEEPATCAPQPGADCSGVAWAGRDLSGMALPGITLTGADLQDVRMDDTDLSGGSLDGIVLAGAVGQRAHLSSARAASAVFVQASLPDLVAQNLDAPWAQFSSADLSRADLTNSNLSRALAQQVVLTGATLRNADVSIADLSRADLTGTDLTGADLRGANFTGATVDDTTSIAGADLSGATWVDGLTCREGSIGACDSTGSKAQLGASLRPVAASIKPGDIAAIIRGSVEIVTFLDTCAKNLKAGDPCFSTEEEVRFNELRAGLASLRAQIDANQKAMTNALNSIVKDQAQKAVEDKYRELQAPLAGIAIAALKEEELTVCLEAVSDPEETCLLTNQLGTPGSETVYPVPNMEAVYAGSRGNLADMYDKGPVARLIYATLWKFGGREAYDPNKLVDVGHALLTDIAGSKEARGSGLLPRYIQLLKAEVNQRLSATPGSVPPLLPVLDPSAQGGVPDLISMNKLTDYFVWRQTQYFSAVISGLQLRNHQTAAAGVVKTLQELSAGGAYEQEYLALANQSRDYSFPLDAAAVASPDRVGFYFGADGKLYRVQKVYEPSMYASYPDFAYPTYETLQLFQANLVRANTNLGAIQSAYPLVLPAGQGTAWWARFGDRYKEFRLENTYRWGTKSSDKFKAWDVTFRSPGPAPENGIWGDNVASWSSNACVMPVRMWSGKPSLNDLAAAEAQGGLQNLGYPPRWESETYFLIKRGDPYKHFTFKGIAVTVHPQSSYDTLVRNGATPAYDFGVRQERNAGPNVVNGIGLAYRCGGFHSNQVAADVSATYMLVNPTAIQGAFTRFGAAPRTFESCDALRDADWRGIGQEGARDEATSTEVDASGFPAKPTLFRVNDAWYEANQDLDIDGDGIACELSDTQTR